ncbi:MAG: lytic murein transglycosylase [Minisyncoccia bacterium]
MRKTVHIFFMVMVLLVASVGQVFVPTQNVYAFNCLTDLTLSSSPEERQQCQNEVNDIDRQIEEWTAELNKQKQKTGSITKDISVLTAQINKAKLEIQNRNLVITKLTAEIGKRQEKINNLGQKISSTQDSISDLLRKTREIDNTTPIHLLLSGQTVSEFYHDVDAFGQIKSSLKEHVDVVKEVKSDTEVEKQTLQNNKADQLDAKVELEQQKKKVELTEAQKKVLLKESKSQEKTYEQIVAEKQKQKQAILSKLFALRDVKSIEFGDALRYAKEASVKTGVRPAMILAIITQESSLGKNVGTCNRPNDPQSKNWKVIMPGPEAVASGRAKSNWQDDYLQIVNELGLSPEGTPLSCPIAGGGWGGAMGPSQFIPPTWNSYKPRIAAALGKATVNPWNAEDAIMATALYLQDRGAAGGSYTNERNAACKYYSGSACQAGRRPPNAFYGDSVMAIAKKTQATIDQLQTLE